MSLLLLRRHLRRFIELTVFVVLPAIVVILGFWAVMAPQDRWFLVLATFVVAPLVHGPFTVLTGRLLFSDDVTARQALREVGGRLSGLFRAWMAQTVALVFGVCSGVMWIVTLPVTVYVFETALLERVGAQATVGRSSNLAWRHSSAAVVAVLAFGLLTLWGGLVGEFTGQVVVGFLLQLGEPFGSLWNLQLTPYVFIGMLLVQPLFAIFRLLLYVDVRTRVEGWDLQVALRAAGLGAAPPEGAA